MDTKSLMALVCAACVAVSACALPPLAGPPSGDTSGTSAGPSAGPISGNTERSAEEAARLSVCGADRLRDVIDKARAEIDPARLPEQFRFLSPGTMRTMDYVPERLNLFLDEERRVKNLNCG